MFRPMQWLTQLPRRPLKESVGEVLDEILSHKSHPPTLFVYTKARNLLSSLEALRNVQGGTEYLIRGYKKDKDIVKKFKAVQSFLATLEEEIGKEFE